MDSKEHNRYNFYVIFLSRGRVGITRLAKGLLFLFLLIFSGYALSGDKEAGEERYKKTCINCHGPAGKGVASYPKISGNEVSYTTSKLETYRDGIKIGPNSSLMIMFAKPLTDEEIANLAAYLKDAKYEIN
ncbi:c-type cytochrome [uncultured Muriicola sp.]|uniref:c-type cytochrome n=1 Tax=uncultured Muriicola sp. TaxID=1583102 RepID=UPI002607FB16|nr:c-type cytochrome [uncultured Muriicola sp.]